MKHIWDKTCLTEINFYWTSLITLIPTRLRTLNLENKSNSNADAFKSQHIFCNFQRLLQGILYWDAMRGM